MLTKYFLQQRVMLFVFLIANLLLVACSSNNASNSTPIPTRSAATSAQAILRHSPSGTVRLDWDRANHKLTIHVSLSGLAPRSVHPAHIHLGNCHSPGRMLFGLNDVRANEVGFADTVTEIKNVTNGIPASGWYVNVHNGPGLQTDAQFMPIACADILSHSVPTRVLATLNATTGSDQSASGTSQLTVSNKQLTVRLLLQDLAPHSVHGASISTGSCASQGPVAFNLEPVMADATGGGSSITVIPNISSIPHNGWYIIIHYLVDITQQTGNDPIMCADIIA